MPEEIAAMLRRLDMTERNQTDFAKAVTAVITDINEIRKPLDELKTDREVRKVRDQHLNERLDRIEASIKSIYRLGLWVLTAFGSASIALVVNFVFRGGFNAP